MAEFDAALARELRRPMVAEDVRFKVQQTFEGAARVVAYIDARSVIGRLNLLVPGGWEAAHEALPIQMRLSMPDGVGGLAPARLTDGTLERDATLVYRCRLVIRGRRFEDAGEGEDPKSAHADSLKRAAVRAGVGEFLYHLRIPVMRHGDEASELRTKRRGRPYLDERSERELRALYGRWLEGEGRAFGPPLAHGPGEDAVVLELPARDTGGGLAERLAAAAATLPGGLPAAGVAALAAVVCEQAEASEDLRLSEEEGERVLGALADAARAGWGAAELEQLLGRALASGLAPPARAEALRARLRARAA